MSASHCLTVALLVASVSAQQGGSWGPWGSSPCLPYEPENRLTWPSSGFGNPADFRRTVVLELDGDRAPDAVVNAGGTAVVLWSAAGYEALQAITFPTSAPLTSVVDLAAMPLGDEGVSDLLFVTDHRGLLAISHQNGVFAEPQLIVRNPWVNAGPIHVVDLDGDGFEDDVVGVTADRTTVVTRIGNGTGFPAGVSYPHTSPVIDALPLAWGPGGETMGVAVLAEDGLHVHAPPQSNFFPLPSTTGCLERVPGLDVPGGEVLAWTHPASGGGTALTVLNQGLSQSVVLAFAECSIGSFTPTAILAGNYDHDGNDDLLLVNESRREAIVLENLAETPPATALFDPADPNAYDVVALCPGTPTTSGVGIPAFAQLDGYRHDDLLAPVNGTSAWVSVFLSLPAERADPSGGQPPPSNTVFPEYTEYTLANGSALGELRLAFGIPALYQDFNKVLVKVWFQGSPNGGLSTQGFKHTLYDLEMDQGVVADEHQWVSVRAFPEEWPTEMTNGVYGEYHHYYVELRFQKYNGPLLLDWSPKFFGGFTLGQQFPVDLDDACFTYVKTMGIPGTAFVVSDEMPDPSGDPQLSGVYVPMSSLPPFNGAPPSAATLTTGFAHLFE